MSEGLNRVLLLGNLGAEPDFKVFENSSVLKFRMACSESYYDKSTQIRKEKTEWVSVSVWGRRGEALSKFLKKGDRVFVEGSLRTSSWDDVDGKRHYRTEVVASNIILNGSGPRHMTKETPKGDGEAYPPPEAEDFGGFEHEDSDIPF